jgi:MHS family proline/betaine transporter-like MFS transporter
MLLIKALSVFAAAFVMRPIGGVVMGAIGDTFGRKRALEISIALMLLPSFLIGCLPTFHQIGWTATALLVFLRLLQGLAAGGELVGAFIYTIESTKGRNRGFWGGSCKATGNLGSSIGIGTASILRFNVYLQYYNCLYMNDLDFICQVLNSSYGAGEFLFCSGLYSDLSG